MSREVQRYEDMSPDGRLILFQQDDGDIIVRVVPDSQQLKDRRCSPFGATVEFCTRGGGGQNINTLNALFALLEAMEKDNIENPQYREISK